jgi:RimJ/RimL family protein N-acetyltransferase
MTSTTSTTLETERLVLRPPAATDVEPIQALCSNWHVVRMTSRVPHPYTLEDTRAWIASRPDRWADGTEYTFAVTRDGALVGIAGIGWKDKDDEYEIGYWIGEPWWGQGLATEAVGRLCRFGFDELGLDRLAAGHFEDNPASGRVLAKCGFRYIGEGVLYSLARGGEVRSLSMELTRDHGRTGS